MTRHKTAAPAPAPLTIGGRPVGSWLEGRAARLTGRVVRRIVDELPVYRLLPREEVHGEIAEIIDHNLRILAHVLSERREATPDELAMQRLSAARRAEEGVPLDAVLGAYHVGMLAAWEEVSADARPDEIADVQAALTLLLGMLRQVTVAVSAAYLEERSMLETQEHHGRRSLMAALIAGDPVDDLAERAGLRPAPHYIVLTLVIGPHPDECAGSGSPKIAARRKLRRVHAELDRFVDDPVLAVIDASGGTVLLPAAGEPPAWPVLCALIDRAARVAGAEITAAGAVAPPAGVPEAVRQTAEVVELVRRTGRGTGLFRLADVLLDYQLSRPGEARERLAALLEPLAGRPELLETLEVFLQTGLSRRRAAGRLHVHPNTIDYRLRRIAQLTGLNAAHAADLPRIGAALVARRAGDRPEGERPLLPRSNG
ncbi:PucR family transcriptional regulator [Yinghuangia soli]|uniref:Helix-turn-helix domain-containing protein n=1 Tax=Yinghuangia soli TaxID=2908204 RepID=A0AA41Q3U9_9ACTN|nr:PucR family transcriptional regulator [Yinghuangia soli]MCF2529602.1 helix-turn-helix domain-containing protein [Yinghuangia soli]